MSAGGVRFLVAIAGGPHPDTCRTRQLSLRAPMVLRGVLAGEQVAARIKLKGQEGTARFLPAPLFLLARAQN